MGEPVAVPEIDGTVGRDAELACALAAVREVALGRAGILVVEGEAGIGKTRLVQSIVDEARDTDVTVFHGHAHPFERSRPFGVVADALGLHRRGRDPATAAISTRLGGTGRPTDAAGDLRFQVIEQIVDLVETSCRERPVLLVAEDVHWADTASLSAISSVARQLPLSPLLVVVTARPSPLSTEAARLLDDLSAAGARTLELRPLAPADVAALARHALGAPPGDELRALLAKAGGNPLWIVAMLGALDDGGLLQRTGQCVDATTSDLPASLHALVVRRLRHLPKGTRDLLQVTAVLGDDVPLRDVATVAHRAPTDVVAELGDAFEAQLLDETEDRVVFRHQVVHDAIYQHVPAPSRRLLHREAAIALTAAGADRLDVAGHLMLGAERGDEEVIAALRDCPREAATRSPDLAVELVRRAESLLPGGHDDADLVSLEVVDALLRAGRVAEASARAEAVLARTHRADTDIPIRLALLGALALENRATEVIAVAEAGLAHPTGLGPTEQVLMLTQQSWALTFSGAHATGDATARRALAIAESADDPASTVWALTSLLVAEGRLGRFGDALMHARRATALTETSPVVRSLPLRPKLFVGLALFDADLVDEARGAYREALEDEFGSGWWTSDTLMADAQASFALGEWDDAVPRLIAGGEAAREKHHPLLESQSIAYRAIIATATGDLRAATDLVARLPEVREGEPPIYNAGVVVLAVALLAIAEGDQPKAFEALLHCWRIDAATGNRYYHRALAPHLVRVALALGHHDVAHDVADVVAESAAIGPEVPTLQSAALRCRGLITGDIEPMLASVDLARDARIVGEHTGACEDAAVVLAAAGQRDDAVAMLAEALELHERTGADSWAARVRARLRELGVRPGQRGPRDRPTHGWDSLTDTERTVSTLVAEGLTNNAVARRLYISPHTVNTHLRHVFAKLGVSNRVELAVEVHRTIE